MGDRSAYSIGWSRLPLLSSTKYSTALGPSSRSLPVDLNIFFTAAMGDGDHDADAD
jgi:hypothetical protein